MAWRGAKAIVIGGVLGLAPLFAWGGCGGEGGAVSVRWRIVDLRSGGRYDPREQTGPGGSCRCLPRDFERTGGSCADTYGWTVHSVRLAVMDPDTGEEPMRGNPGLEFHCAEREATTPFILPLGTFALSLHPYNPSNPTAEDAGLTPPPVVREIRRSEKINLDVVEIGVNGPWPTVP